MVASLPKRRLVAAAVVVICGCALAACGALPRVPPPQYPYPIWSGGGR
jgi:hypothetical protein